MNSRSDDDVMSGLRSLYLKQLKERLSTLEQAEVDLQLGLMAPNHFDALEFEIHRLNGTGATYGFPKISASADELELHLRSTPRDPAIVAVLLGALVAAIREALAESPEALAIDQITAQTPVDGHASYRPTVLIIDDDPAILNLAMQLLSSWVNVECAESGGAGLSALQSRRFDLVILDNELPDMNGLEVLLQIGEMYMRSPVMMLTAERSPAKVSRLISAGAQHYLVKPIAPDHFIERVAFLLHRQKKTVMVVDDDPLVREIFRKRFTQRGHEVVLATNGVQGLQMARQLLPHTIVLDRQMPRLDGMEVLQQLRRDETTRSIPIVMLSAHCASGDVYAGYRGGANAYIGKPFVPDQVIDCCERLLEPRDTRSIVASAKAAWQSCAFI